MKNQYLALTFLAVVILTIGFLNHNDYYFNILNILFLKGLIVIGLSLLMGYAGQVSLGHAAFYGLGAYTSGILTAKFGWGCLPALGVAQLVTFIAALMIGLPALRLKGHYLAMATLGFGVIVYIFFKELISLTGGPSGLVGIPPLEILGKVFMESREYYFLFGGILFLALLGALHLAHSPFGRGLLAIHDSEAATVSLGYDTNRLKLIVFLLSAALAGLAGSLYAHFAMFIAPTSFTFLHSVKLVTMVVIGGVASLWGALLGAAVLTILPEVLTVFEDYDVLVFGAILVLIMIFLPEGLFKGLGKWIGQFRHKIAT
ncbi:branched-chain amino acid ABC transporter permease [Thermodesulfatator autotrophicus]|uniref:Branched-chain amino acid ABC transporter permease n=1 Tax=Thermodesulfatator autotrophicus TaxID=1795632 RepID=A0A177E7D8_9BACT|nr:branched-chain amino acid ABC transporter permease [Thermodesulfatator autotrophicus]OAG27805.1 branched-chain amino acid ABC transporter permease [Thermodesulfatator autotrophicus]